MMLDLKPSQYIAWCKQVIHHAAVKAICKKRKPGVREILLINQPLGEASEEWVETAFSSEVLDDFEKTEWRLLISSLSKVQEQVTVLYFVYGFNQQEIAKRLRISQQQVSRIRKNAMKILWQQLRDVYAW